MSTPTCINYGCNNKVAYVKKNTDGTKINRAVCGRCHKLRNDPGTLFGRYGVTEFKKNYCENTDCTATIVDRCQLDLDHVDGDKNNNTPENVRTVCKNCHAIKTKTCGDHSKSSNVPLPSPKFDFWEEEGSLFEEA